LETPSINTVARKGVAAIAPALADTHAFDVAPYLSAEAQRVRDLSVEQWGEARAVEMVGHDRAFMDLIGKALRIAPYHEPVLITGESGAGKESLAQALYLLGSRRGQPFVSVNCPQYQDGNLTVSELFGHRRGSFTGAIADRKGCFETADGGMIFLDEIADLHMSAQVMLLRALAQGEFQPLGADFKRNVNVRVVAATNRSLNQLMVGQEFRHDLFFRLRYFLLTVPPLRERGEDWRLLLDYALFKLHKKYGVVKRFSPESLDLLTNYKWPGNVRQLMSVATMGYALATGDVIEPDDFMEQLDLRGRDPGDSAEDLYQRVVVGHEDFWNVVHEPFMARELNRTQLRFFIKKGLVEAKNSYRDLIGLLHIGADEYQKFMDFLRHHRLKP
jgi:DNA-binding NtrC family response regulator